MLERAAGAHPDRPALSWREEQGWTALPYRELRARVQQAAAGLRAFGLRRGDRLASIAGSLPEWVVCDFAALALGVIDAPLFSTLTVSQIAAILEDAGARVLLVHGEEQLHRAHAVRQAIPDLRIIVIGSHRHEGEEGVTPWSEILALGAASPIGEEEWRELLRELDPDGLASIIYTSGTTGEPKGVMLSHRNFCSNVDAIADIFNLGPNDVMLSFLPVCHVFERTVGHYFPLSQGSCIAYAESLLRLRENLREIEPTLMIMVPRVAEAFEDAIGKRAAKAPPLRRKLFAWSLRTGLARVGREQARRPIGLRLTLAAWVAERLVNRRIRKMAGMGRLRGVVSGGAALSPHTGAFFQALGIDLVEGYGLTETSPVLTTNRPGHTRIGTVGPAIDGVELHIGDAGEILARGECVMLGYWGKPEATAEVVDPDGWFHTGDVGQIDADGCLRITDRLKELVVLGNGKNVAPQPIENALRRSPLIAQAAVFGDGKSYVGALIVPDWSAVDEWARGAGASLREDRLEAVRAPALRKAVKREIAAHTEHFAGFEKVHCFELLVEEFTVESGEMTPTLKLRRRAIAARRPEAIAAMFRETT